MYQHFSDLRRSVARRFQSLDPEDVAFIKKFASYMDERFLARKKCLMLGLLHQSEFSLSEQKLAREVGVSRPTIRTWMNAFVKHDLRRFLNSSKLVTHWDKDEFADQSEPLTASETDIVLDVVNGLAPKQIAMKRGSALSTVYNRLRNIRGKIGHHDIAAWAHQQSYQVTGHNET